MKYLMIIFLFLTIKALSQNYNHSKIDSVKNEKMLIGPCTREVFYDTAFSNWFNESYNNYHYDEQILNQLKPILNNIKIKVVLGTWCGDSKDFVPAFLKILDQLDFSDENLELICVDRKKKGFENEVDGLDIHFVPTYIFYRDEVEIGRIVELPNQTLERDFLEILKNN
jgi:hypothetical protein